MSNWLVWPAVAAGRWHHLVMTAHRRGEENHFAKLTQTDVAEIRRLRTEEGYSYNELGRLYRMHPMSIGRVCRGETWRRA